MSKKLLIIIIGIAIFIVGSVFYFQKNGYTIPMPQPEQGTTTEKNDATSQAFQKGTEVHFTAPDGYSLSATYWPPESSPSPAVILAHQFGSNRHDFDDFIPLLLKEGYAVLAYDIRGFGESRSGKADINDFPLDVVGAVSFLQKQDGVDAARIGIIGASVGANVAYVASGSIGEIKAAVSLSPSNTGSRGALMGTDIKGFAPRNILIASDEREKSDADVIYALSGDSKEQKIYPGFGHGKSLLKSSEARKDILLFLKQMLSADL